MLPSIATSATGSHSLCVAAQSMRKCHAEALTRFQERSDDPVPRTDAPRRVSPRSITRGWVCRTLRLPNKCGQCGKEIGTVERSIQLLLSGLCTKGRKLGAGLSRLACGWY